MPVGIKLGLALIVPLLAIIVLGGVAATGFAAQAGRAGDLRTLAATAASAGSLIDGLQRERLAAAVLLADGVDPARTDLVDATARTEHAVVAFRDLRAGVPRRDPSAAMLARVDGRLDALTDLRTRVAAGPPGAPASSLLLAYRDLIVDLITVRADVEDRPGSATVRLAAGTAQRLTIGKEALALGQITAVQAIGAGTFTAAAQQAFVSSRTAYADAVGHLSGTGLAGRARTWQARLDVELGAADVVAADRLAGQLAATPVDAPALLDGGVRRWADLSGKHLDALRSVEDLVDRASVNAATRARAAGNRTLVAVVALVLAVLGATVGLAVVTARSIGRSLRRLESREAARAAAEQAAIRDGVSTMMVHLARRSLRLVDHLIQSLDDAERDEPDPARLELLFRFDHLATRMRHANESLLTLAGRDTARVRVLPVPLIDVLRAGQAQVEQYIRVEFGRVDNGVAVAPHAVDAVVHLVAELLDNATRFSSPETLVMVNASRTGDAVVIAVTDRGCGIDQDALAEINARLADPRALDVADPQAMGIAVVARLAARHGLTVTLSGGPGAGTVAEVVLPSAAIRPAALFAPAAAVNGVLAKGVLADGASGNGVAGDGASGNGASGNGVPGNGVPVGTGVAIVMPRPLERGPALPGGEPLGRAPRFAELPPGAVPGVIATDGNGRPASRALPGQPLAVTAVPFAAQRPSVEGALPRRTPGNAPFAEAAITVTAGSGAVADPDEVRSLLSTYQHALGRFGTPPVPVAEPAAEEGAPD